ncbi:hypothetical protein FRC15_000685 [Serendipita sp. 397]|nr:hypothetical protein FRC15_000685 [Serendipita sp. 397]
MDHDALKFIEDRQILLKEAYERYKQEFGVEELSTTARNDTAPGQVARKRQGFKVQSSWISKKFRKDDIRNLVKQSLKSDQEYKQLRSDSMRRTLEEDVLGWLAEFTCDSGSMFRLYRKSGFDIERASERLRNTIALRIHHRNELLPNSRLQPSETSTPVSETRTEQTGGVGKHESEQHTDKLFRLYGPSRTDIYRQPLIIVSSQFLEPAGASSTSNSVPSPKARAIATFERVRKYLVYKAEVIREEGLNEAEPLQCVIVIDLAGARVNSSAWDMVKWLRRDAVDLFPGLCSAVFVVNYSREFGAIWIACKQLLPASAKARIIFPTKEELLSHFGSENLPPSLGGICDVPLFFPLPTVTGSSSISSDLISVTTPASGEEDRRLVQPKSTITPLYSMSNHNPYYGYPVVRQEGSSVRRQSVHLTHSRKRKRDLLRTLIWLFFLKTRERFYLALYHLSSLPRGWTMTLLTGILALFLWRRTKWSIHLMRGMLL